MPRAILLVVVAQRLPDAHTLLYTAVTSGDQDARETPSPEAMPSVPASQPESTSSASEMLGSMLTPVQRFLRPLSICSALCLLADLLAIVAVIARTWGLHSSLDPIETVGAYLAQLQLYLLGFAASVTAVAVSPSSNHTLGPPGDFPDAGQLTRLHESPLEQTALAAYMFFALAFLLLDLTPAHGRSRKEGRSDRSDRHIDIPRLRLQRDRCDRHIDGPRPRSP